MSPWKIALGLTGIPLALGLIWIPTLAGSASLLLAAYWAVWHFARRLLLTDVGGRVRIMGGRRLDAEKKGGAASARMAGMRIRWEKPIRYPVRAYEAQA